MTWEDPIVAEVRRIREELRDEAQAGIRSTTG
jgi:hypothetical protein